MAITSSVHHSSFSLQEYRIKARASIKSRVPFSLIVPEILVANYLKVTNNKWNFNELNKKASNLLEAFQVRLKGVEPPRLAALDPKSSMSTNSITAAYPIH